MNTLDDAWRWYQTTRESLRLVSRIARRYWNTWDSDSPLGRDPVVRTAEPTALHEGAEAALEELNVFAVFVLFSLFEAEVRDSVLEDTAPERAAVTHTALSYWMAEAEQAIKEGSFFRVLDALKAPDLHDVIEQVNQVRRYRNWVAHGRREEPQASVTPPEAYRRLRGFLDALNPPPAPPPV